MNATPLDIKTQDGVVDGFFFQPDGDGGGKHPAIIFYMDGIGLRQGLYDMAERLTENGYAVLMPNMFYRYGPAQPLDFAMDRDKIMEMIFSLNEKGMMQDTEHFLAYLDAQPGVLGLKVGCTGYCMGGAPSLTIHGHLPRPGCRCGLVPRRTPRHRRPRQPALARARDARRALHRCRRRRPLPRPRRNRAPLTTPSKKRATTTSWKSTKVPSTASPSQTSPPTTPKPPNATGKTYSPYSPETCRKIKVSLPLLFQERPDGFLPRISRPKRRFP